MPKFMMCGRGIKTVKPTNFMKKAAEMVGKGKKEFKNISLDPNRRGRISVVIVAFMLANISIYGADYSRCMKK
jgi:hypothetical protein